MDPINIDEDSVEASTTVGATTDNTESIEEIHKKKKAKGLHVGKGANRKLRSPAWNSFELIPLGEDKKKRARCKQSGIIYACDSSYGMGNMLHHIPNYPKKRDGDIKQMLLSNSQGHVLMKSPNFDYETFRNLVIEAIIKHDLPFNFVEYEGIRAIFSYISVDLKLPCRNTVKACMLRMFKTEKQKLHNLLDSVQGRVSLTSELWTSASTDSYLTLTAHFVDQEWKLQKRILNFCHIPPPHTGVALSDKINSLLTDWGIEKKIFSITLDNASVNDCFVEILKNQLNFRGVLLMSGQFFHVRCCAHILNLIVQDGLKEIDDSVTRIRECIKYIRGSSSRKHKFYDCVAQVGIVGIKRGLRQDVPTRWNSTHIMLESAIFYRRALINLGLCDSNFNCCPSPEEWDKIEKISKFLGYFYEVTCLFSGTKYPTSNLFFPPMFIIQHYIKSAMEGSDSFLRKMGTYMNLKFEKYWSESSLIFAISIILDPRYKIHFVDWAYSRLHGKNSYEFQRVRDTLISLFKVYMDNLSYIFNTSTTVNEASSQMKSENLIFEDFDIFCKDNASSSKKTELDKYLDEGRLDRKQDLDVLSWWKMEQFRYPILSHLARDVLSVPISTVASESAFSIGGSIGGRVLDQYCSSLMPENVQALLCTRDWLFGKGVQDVEKSPFEELMQDVFNLNIEESKSGQCSNSVSLDV